MKNCPKCGAEVFDEAILCVHCNNILKEQTEEYENNNIKLCPECGNKCDKNAILCVKCGFGFNRQNKVKESKNKGKIISVIAIVLGVIGTLSLTISMFSYGVDINSLLSVIASIVVLVGMIIGKKNKITAIGYIISALATFISVFLNEDLLLLVSIVQILMVAILYMGMEQFKKLWFVPVIMSAIISFVAVIINLSNSVYESGYYYTYFDWEIFIIDIATRIGSVIGVSITCLNAKLNWYKDEI